MSEKLLGKLQKELEKTEEPLPKEYVSKAAVLELFDEAKDDFPFLIFFNGENSYSFDSKKTIAEKGDDTDIEEDFDEIKREVAEWLEKWFFGTKEKKGLYLVNPDDSKTEKLYPLK